MCLLRGTDWVLNYRPIIHVDLSLPTTAHSKHRKQLHFQNATMSRICFPNPLSLFIILTLISTLCSLWGADTCRAAFWEPHKLLTGSSNVSHPDPLSNTSQPEYLRLPLLALPLQLKTLLSFETSQNTLPETRRHISDDPNRQKERLWKNKIWQSGK